jgi:hypothetical protein
MINNKRILKTGALAVVMTVVFAIFAFRAADWTKGLSSEFIVYGQAGSGSSGSTGGTGTTGSTGSTSTTKVVAQVTAGNFGNVEPRNYGTVVEIINTTTAAETFSGNFYNEDGTASTAKFKTNLTTLATFTGSFSSVSVPAGGILVINVGTDADTTPTNASTMWGKITSTGAFTMAGFFELRDSGSKALFARVGVAASRADMTSFVIPRIRQASSGAGVADIDTGFALVNTGSAAVLLTATIKDATGVTLGTKSIALSPGQHIADFSNHFFGLSGESTARQYQYMTFTAGSASMGAVALALEGGSLSSFPVDVLQ